LTDGAWNPATGNYPRIGDQNERLKRLVSKMDPPGTPEKEPDKVSDRFYCDDSGAFVTPEKQRVMFD
jgi:hypothetical protein